MNEIKNVRIFATNTYGVDGINLYIDFSGHREYIMSHRYNSLLYKRLKNGISLDALRAMGRDRHESKLRQSAAHAARQITKVADDFIKYDWLPYRQAA